MRGVVGYKPGDRGFSVVVLLPCVLASFSPPSLSLGASFLRLARSVSEFETCPPLPRLRFVVSSGNS